MEVGPSPHSGSFRLNLGFGKDGVCHKIKAIGIENVTFEFGEYGLRGG